MVKKEDKAEAKNEHPGKAFPRRNVTAHLDRDDNDPRRNPVAETGFSLDKDDPEKDPEPQNPVK